MVMLTSTSILLAMTLSALSAPVPAPQPYGIQSVIGASTASATGVADVPPVSVVTPPSIQAATLAAPSSAAAPSVSSVAVSPIPSAPVVDAAVASAAVSSPSSVVVSSAAVSSPSSAVVSSAAVSSPSSVVVSSATASVPPPPSSIADIVLPTTLPTFGDITTPSQGGQFDDFLEVPGKAGKAAKAARSFGHIARGEIPYLGSVLGETVGDSEVFKAAGHKFKPSSGQPGGADVIHSGGANSDANGNGSGNVLAKTASPLATPGNNGVAPGAANVANPVSPPSQVSPPAGEDSGNAGNAAAGQDPAAANPTPVSAA